MTARWVAGLLVVAGVVLAGLALWVARRRGAHAGRPLAVLLVAAAWWGLAGAVELAVDDPQRVVLWGDLKYVGIVVVPPAWLVFVLMFTGRRAWVTRRRLALLAVEPLLVVLVLALPGTHDLFRYLPADEAGEAFPVVATGPLFWVHAAYGYLLVVVATATFVRALLRASRAYRPLSVALLVAALLPWSANVLFNLQVGPFARLDLTPFLFVLTGAVLVVGLWQGRLLVLARVGRDVVLDSLSDGVLVVDPLGRVVEANPAAARLLSDGASPVGTLVTDLLPLHPAALVRVEGPAGPRVLEVRRYPLLDRAGADAGEALLLRDVTERLLAEARIDRLLQERTRVAAALQTALLPAVLPQVPGLRLAALYRPAGHGREIGGDFYEVFPVPDGRWCAVLGDVAGKGAEAAAVTARVRFTLRALSTGAAQAPELLRGVNAALTAVGDDERFCTLAHLLVRPGPLGAAVDVVLAGHLQPLVRRRDGRVETVGEPGTALGLVPDPELAQRRVDLGDGELLCLFTDGLVEARDPGGAELGAQRLAEALAGCDPADLDAVPPLLERVAREWHGGPLDDDVAVLLLAAAPAPAG
ncbi:histidine kinase N-terminal 7TM domain-containing protein [Aquipuribacter sp. SD81]|uniref:histidine kinase N-terminal 7TM domain-containing protein n=1 Tax=Aquipuribacter sp. SD81 TaxID=3127703 RepID=UPI0030175332